ncbi:hypothetical protein H1R20_g7520, partial [Candolleomyces eurysporus]
MVRPREFGHLFSTNTIPNIVEAASVQSGIGMLNMKISTLRKHLQELEEDLRMHRAVLSSVRRMPIDVLGEIFRYALPSDPVEESEFEEPPERVDRSKIPLYIPSTTLQRLTSLYLVCDWRGFHVLILAQHCQSLETLTADFQGSHFIYSETNPLAERQLANAKIITIPNLRELRLRNMMSACVDIFEHLSTPKLVTLDLSFRSDPSDYGPDGYEFGPRLEKFIKTQSKCQDTFRAFKLRTAWIESEELIKIFKAYPLLTHVTLDDVSFGSGSIGSFWWELWQQFLWYEIPKCLAGLEVLELLQLPPTKFRFEHLCRFIEERPPFRVRFVGGDSTKGELKGNLTRLVVTYQKTKPLGLHRQDRSHVIWRLRRECGTSVEIGPMLYEDSASEHTPV